MPHYSALARGGAGASREPRCPQFVRTTASPDSPRLTPPDLLRAGTSAFQALVLRPRVCGRLCSHTDSTPKHTHRHTHTPTAALGPQCDQARMASSPGDAAAQAQVAVRVAGVGAHFRPFILGFGKKGGQSWAEVPERPAPRRGCRARGERRGGDTGSRLPAPSFLSPGSSPSFPAFPGRRARRARAARARGLVGARRGLRGRRAAPAPRAGHLLDRRRRGRAAAAAGAARGAAGAPSRDSGRRRRRLGAAAAATRPCAPRTDRPGAGTAAPHPPPALLAGCLTRSLPLSGLRGGKKTFF